MKFYGNIPAFVAEELPQPDFLLPGFVPGDPDAFVLIAASSKMGKSTLAAQLCEALVGQTPFICDIAGHHGVQPAVPISPILFIQGDATEGEWQLHLKTVCPKAEFATATVNRNLFSDASGELGKVRKLILELKPRFIVWDALESIAHVNSDLNTKEGSMSTLKTLRDLSKTTHCILHHNNKDTEKKWQDRISGHHSLTAQMSMGMSLVGSPKKAKLTVWGRNVPITEYPLVRTPIKEGGRWVLGKEDDDKPLTSSGKW